MSDENKKLVRRFLEEAWNEGKTEALESLVSNQYRYHDPVFPAMAPGVESLKRHIQMCRHSFPDLKLTIDDVIAERNEVVVHWTMHGTHRNSFLGMAPTNRTASVSGTSIHRIDKGKIVEQWSDWNLMTLMEQLGMASAPREQVISAVTR